jgi:hypothetical protein
MLLVELRPAVAANVQNRAVIHVETLRKAYAGIIPDHALGAITVPERARRGVNALAVAGSDETIVVATASNGACWTCGIVDHSACLRCRFRENSIASTSGLIFKYGGRQRAHDQHGSVSSYSRYGVSKPVGCA